MNFKDLNDIVKTIKEYDLDLVIVSKNIEREWYLGEYLPKSKDLIEYFKDINPKMIVFILDMELPLLLGTVNLGVKMYNVTNMLDFGVKCLQEGECNIKMLKQ